MKTEDFDDAIRNKFESVNQKYEEQEIENVYNYVRQNLHLSFWKIYGVKIAYASCAAAISGLIALNILQHRENKILTQTVDSLKNNSAIVETEVIPAKPDTVFITKYIYQAIPEKNNSTIVSENTAKNSENKRLISTAKIDKVLAIQDSMQKGANKTIAQVSNINNISHENVIKSPDNSPKVEQSGQLIANYNIHTEPGQKNYAGTFNNNQPIKDIQNEALVSDSTSRNITVKNSEIENPKTGPEKNPVNDSTETGNPAKARHISHKTSLLADATKQIKSTISEAKNSLRSDPSPSQISLKYLHYRAGISFEMANRQMGANIIGEILFSKRWGLSAGMKFLRINNETYHDENDFHSRKGQYFDKVYENQVTDTSSISNIGMRNFLIQIPVTLNYQLPLKNNFALLMGVGTDLDIYAKQFVNFDNQNSDVRKNFETVIPAKLFNNLVISTGLQKKWRHYVLQIRPFVSPQLISVVYKKEDAYFGVKCNFLFTTED